MVGGHLVERIRVALRTMSKDTARAKNHSQNTATRSTAINKSNQDLYNRYLNKKADSNIEPFLKLLHSNDLIDCPASPRKAAPDTQIKIQQFTYFAHQCFGLKFDYFYTLYVYGPYAPGLANDYYRIQNIKDASDEGLKNWAEKVKFLDFARRYNDVERLEVASTLVYLHKKHDLSMKELIDSAGRIKCKFSRLEIEDVHNALNSEGFFEAK